jgi:hypothetical protein
MAERFQRGLQRALNTPPQHEADAEGKDAPPIKGARLSRQNGGLPPAPESSHREQSRENVGDGAKQVSYFSQMHSCLSVHK